MQRPIYLEPTATYCLVLDLDTPQGSTLWLMTSAVDWVLKTNYLSLSLTLFQLSSLPSKKKRSVLINHVHLPAICFSHTLLFFIHPSPSLGGGREGECVCLGYLCQGRIGCNCFGDDNWYYLILYFFMWWLKTDRNRPMSLIYQLMKQFKYWLWWSL